MPVHKKAVSPCGLTAYEARARGLEPPTTGSTVRYSNQLSYAPVASKPLLPNDLRFMPRFSPWSDPQRALQRYHTQADGASPQSIQSEAKNDKPGTHHPDFPLWDDFVVFLANYDYNSC